METTKSGSSSDALHVVGCSQETRIVKGVGHIILNKWFVIAIRRPETVVGKPVRCTTNVQALIPFM